MTTAPDPSLASHRVADAPPAAAPPRAETYTPPPPSSPEEPPTQRLPQPRFASGEPPRPHRVLRSVLIGLGVFFLVVALLLPLYVYPRVAVLPADPQQEQLLQASGAKILMPDANDPAGARVLENVDVTVANYIAKAPDGADRDDNDDNVVWDLATQVSVPGHGMINARVERISVNPHTAELTNCCGDRIVTGLEEPDGKPLTHEGYIAWPFGVEKHSYQIWDINVERAVTANYVGETTRDGIDVYQFTIVVPMQKTGTMELPGGLFGSKAPNVDAEAWYADTKNYWIEPATGNVIGLTDDITQQYTFGGKTLTAFEAKLASPSMRGDTLEQAEQGALFVPWLKGRASIVLVVLGVLLFVAAFLIGRPRRPKHTAS